ncbi:MAG: terminase large subunit [Micrococcus sp.]|nr:terminase large subunit [Micrococcus sp.]
MTTPKIGGEALPFTPSDQTESAPMLPGLDRARRASADMSQAAMQAIRSRAEDGLITPLDEALTSLVLATASKLDATVGHGRPSGRARLLQSMSEALEELPAPDTAGPGLLAAYLASLLGTEAEQARSASAEPLPAVDPPGPHAGIQETGVRRTLRARAEAGLSTNGYAAHEALALMAARDLDRALSVGAASGFALLSSVMQSILARLPRPAADADAGMIDALLSSTTDDTPSPFTVLPNAAHHPERDPAWLSEADEIAQVARAMGRHLMPWQYRALDVATQYKLDAGHRRYRYTTVMITVPRQSGKTDLTIPWQIHRSITRGGPAAVWYTAQSGQDARKRIMDLIERVEGTLLRLLFTASRSNGAEGVRARDLVGSHVTRFSPTFSALHGEHPHLVTMDEVWHYSKELGDALLGAVEPGQITLGSRAQTVLISTMGTVNSDWMNAYVDKGRAAVDGDLCYIEYSLPDEADPFDPSAWWQFHPALGNTIAEEDLARRARDAESDPAKRATWLRAYCNRVVSSDGSLFDLALWDDLAMEIPAPEPGTFAVAFEVAPGNAAAAVVAGWTDARTGRPCVRIIHQAPGTDWLIPYLDQTLPAELGVPATQVPLTADGAGPSARFVTKLQEMGHEVRTLSMAQFGQACEAVLAAAGTDESLIHDGSDELRAQAAAVEVRTSNGVRRFSRESPRPVPALIGAAVALWSHEHPETEGFTGIL